MKNAVFPKQPPPPTGANAITNFVKSIVAETIQQMRSAAPEASAQITQEATFEEIAAQWLAAKKTNVKPSTYDCYSLAIHRTIIPHLKGLAQVGEAHVQRVVDSMADSGLSKKYTLGTVAVIKAVLKFGSKRGLCAPPKDWEINYRPQAKGLSKPRKALLLEEHRQLLSWACDNINPRSMGVLLALCTGMRVGEVCALRWENVDLKSRMLHVRETLGERYSVEMGKSHTETSTPKTQNSERALPLSRPLYKALKTLHKKRQSPYVVNNTNGGQMRPRVLREYLTYHLKKLGMEVITFHGLRHTFATRLIESGVDIKTVSVLLGHADPAFTYRVYIHATPDQKREAVEKMNRALDKKKKNN